jgi:hypothetical protein
VETGAQIIGNSAALSYSCIREGVTSIFGSSAYALTTTYQG